MLERKIKRLALRLGADDAGIAPVERFTDAPEGFRPADVYPACRSVLAFVKRLPRETLYGGSRVVYTHENDVVTRLTDDVAYRLSIALEDLGIPNVPVPTDDPYEFWDAGTLTGKGILSMRHLAFMAGLGYLGRNTLLIHPRFGNLVQIGAVLLDAELRGDPVSGDACPENCRLCVKSCPSGALEGKSVTQANCRPLTVSFKNERGFSLKNCWECRKVCPRAAGYLK